MAHFAKLDQNNLVIEVNVVNNDDIQNLPFPESEPVGIEFLTNWSNGYTNKLLTMQIFVKILLELDIHTTQKLMLLFRQNRILLGC